MELFLPVADDRLVEDGRQAEATVQAEDLQDYRRNFRMNLLH
jgi:hypothetical protein